MKFKSSFHSIVYCLDPSLAKNIYDSWQKEENKHEKRMFKFQNENTS